MFDHILITSCWICFSQETGVGVLRHIVHQRRVGVLETGDLSSPKLHNVGSFGRSKGRISCQALDMVMLQ